MINNYIQQTTGVNMFAIGNVILYIADNRQMFGARAPFVVARALRLSPPSGAFSSSATHDIMGAEVTIGRAFIDYITADIRHLQIFAETMQNGPSIDLGILLLALFSRAELDELQKVPIEDFSTLPKVIGDKLRAKSVDWVDEWVVVS